MSSDQSIMFVFPGQGSQYVGMGSDLCAEFPIAQQVYEEANDTLGYDITTLSAEGPEETLGLTRHTQPALLTHEIACFRAYQELTGGVQAKMAAGHSLGEYTALVVAGVISFADGLQLVKRRGELMGEHGEGGMLALGLTIEEAATVADRFCCQIASCNLPQQTVVGGTDADLDALEAALPEIYPRKRATRLKTEGAFHTYLMVTAAREFRTVLDSVEFGEADFDVLSNYTGLTHEAAPDSIRTRLFFQLFNTVDWVGCMRAAAQAGISRFIEFGGGIGKGETPAEKKPNLQSIINKNLRALDHEAEYTPIINAETLKAAAQDQAA